MSRVNSIRDAWHPQTREDRDAILLELQQILASPHFCNSKRYPALLQYIVEHTLAGKADQLKERTLGVEVFERMHYVCFHYEFEHDPSDPDEECNAGGCPSFKLDALPRQLRIETAPD